jgi:hypothetical protein
MPMYNITLVGGTQMQVEAARMEVDGSGLRLFDENDVPVAFWSSGVVESCYPAAPQAEPAAE